MIIYFVSVKAATDMDALSRYVAGFNECTKEVTKYLTSVDALNDDARTCILRHLANSLDVNRLSVTPPPQTAIADSSSSRLRLISAPNNDHETSNLPVMTSLSNTSLSSMKSLPTVSNTYIIGERARHEITSPSDDILQTPRSTGHMQVMPARLASGEVVFLLATSNSTQHKVLASTLSGSYGEVDALEDHLEERLVCKIVHASSSLIPTDCFSHQSKSPSEATIKQICDSSEDNQTIKSSPSTLLELRDKLCSRTSNGQVDDTQRGPRKETVNDETELPTQSVDQQTGPYTETILHGRTIQPTTDMKVDKDERCDILNNNLLDIPQCGSMWRPW